MRSRRSHEHHANAGKEKKRVVFPLLLLFNFQIFTERRITRAWREKESRRKEERIDKTDS